MPLDVIGASKRPPGEVTSIVILRALFLGDLLLSVPAWRALRRRYPRAELTLIGLPWAEAFVAGVPHLIDRLVLFPGYPGIPELAYDPARTAAFLAEQRAYGYDLALQMHGDGSATNGFVAELGARVSLGYALPGDERLSVRLPHKGRQHEVVRWLRLVETLGAPSGDSRPEFHYTMADRAAAADLLGAGPAPVVALHLGAKDPERRWPPLKFAALGDALAERIGAQIVLTGTAGERGLAAQVLEAMSAPALDLSGRTELGVFAAVLERVDLLVCNDTGASHLAAATGTPSVVLFGPSRPEQYGPLDGALHMAVDALAYGLPGEQPDEALRRLPVDTVLAAALAQLGRARTLRGRLARVVGGEEALCAG
jgi:ADP-heptose:LPS heptosyltransferase